MLLDKRLATRRLYLRTLSAADASDAYLGWMRDPKVTGYLESRFAPPERAEELVAFIEAMNAAPDNLLLGIFLQDDGRHIGNIKIGPIVVRHARSEIGYLIGDVQAWGKGYASEAIREVCRFCFDELGLEKVTAGTYETNLGSARALEKAGFSLEAKIESDVIFEGARIASLRFGTTADQFKISVKAEP